MTQEADQGEGIGEAHGEVEICVAGLGPNARCESDQIGRDPDHDAVGDRPDCAD